MPALGADVFVLGHALATGADALEAMIARKVRARSRRPERRARTSATAAVSGAARAAYARRSDAGRDAVPVRRLLDDIGSLADIPALHRLHACPARGYDCAMDVPRARRIWHFEAEPLCDALNEAGAWQTAVRIRVAHEEALRHRPEGTAFDVRPTPEDVAPLNLALDKRRAERVRESRL